MGLRAEPHGLNCRINTVSAPSDCGTLIAQNAREPGRLPMNLKPYIRNALPYGLVRLYWDRGDKVAAASAEDQRQQRAKVRNQRRREAAQQANGRAVEFSYQAALDFLDLGGIAPFHSREGSIPLKSLEYAEAFISRLDDSRPLMALHIGNFVGVSLAYLASLLGSIHPGSKVVSMDPNIPHRGIERPADITIALLCHFGLEGRVAILQGYSLEKNASNDGEIFEGYDPRQNWNAERACTNQLDLLNALSPRRFDICLIDGNHEAAYLERELRFVSKLLRQGGLLILDDVSQAWPEIQSVHAAIAPSQFTKLGADGRIGLLEKT